MNESTWLERFVYMIFGGSKKQEEVRATMCDSAIKSNMCPQDCDTCFWRRHNT